jgi:outer membrane lipoprotein SlyB
MFLTSYFKFLTILFVSFSILVSCQRPNMNVYRYDEVGKTSAVTFGTILQVRSIGIIGENTGGGAAAGALAGAAGGTYIGADDGTAWAVAGLAVAGGIIGYLIEQGFADREGLEYTVILENGVTITTVQEIPEDKIPLKVNSRVLVQTQGGYQRVLPADQLPTEVKRPKGIKLVD